MDQNRLKEIIKRNLSANELIKLAETIYVTTFEEMNENENFVDSMGHTWADCQTYIDYAIFYKELELQFLKSQENDIYKVLDYVTNILYVITNNGQYFDNKDDDWFNYSNLDYIFNSFIE